VLGTRFPLFQAPLGSAATVELAAAVAEEGGLGSLAGSWTRPQRLRVKIRELARRTDAPFAINLVLAFPQEERVALCREERVPVVWLSWGVRPDLVAELQDGGSRVLVQVGSVAEARAAAEAGADELVVQGVEAGGHVQGTTGLLALLRGVSAAVGLPLWAAGGIADEAGARAALVAGAAGVVIGTRYLATDEADAHPVWQEAILAAQADDTVYCTLFDIGWPDAPHRVLRNSTVRAWDAAGRPAPGARPGEDEIVARTDGRDLVRYSDEVALRRTEGDVEALALYAGQGVGAIDRVEAAGEVTARIGSALRR
jgi:nitronate monooxygenase